MKISKRDNVRLQKRLISIFKDILGDAEVQFWEAVHDEIQSYLEEDDELMDITETYAGDAMADVYEEMANNSK